MGRSELITYHLMAKSLIEYSQSPTQNLQLLKQLAQLLSISPKHAYDTFKLLMKNRQDIQPNDYNFIDPKVDAFDQLFTQDFKYQAETILNSKVDMKNWDKVDSQSIQNKTKIKRGISEFVQLIEQQKTSIQRKRLQNIQSVMKQQLSSYAEYLRSYLQ
ncbi:Hypothetical_protein [Hexamita inflata]|uniref:Hypothetical_protein n=1 Tax=Hexamita inflata TaxID=28002 RepID=A0AA86P7A6_9EUKA|nr:Hypothetical protein HINF_LOCUS15116 [Hexamita inflata]CAI9931397.1 Hypothetical protein HINF_LOCUS19042 [Hexamita inflata]